MIGFLYLVLERGLIAKKHTAETPEQKDGLCFAVAMSELVKL